MRCYHYINVILPFQFVEPKRRQQATSQLESLGFRPNAIPQRTGEMADGKIASTHQLLGKGNGDAASAATILQTDGSGVAEPASKRPKI